MTLTELKQAYKDGTLEEANYYVFTFFEGQKETTWISRGDLGLLVGISDYFRDKMLFGEDKKKKDLTK